MVFCIKCGFEIIDENSKFCPKCGTTTDRDFKESKVDNVSKNVSIIPPGKSKWLMLLPIFFSFIGGIIAYFLLREDYPKAANISMVIGIVLFIIGIIVGWIEWASQFR